VHREEDAEQTLEGDYRRFEGKLNHLRVSRVPVADLVVCRICDLPTGEARFDTFDSPEFRKDCLRAPEASSSQGGYLLLDHLFFRPKPHRLKSVASLLADWVPPERGASSLFAVEAVEFSAPDGI
jgi:hypothetical protein